MRLSIQDAPADLSGEFRKRPWSFFGRREHTSLTAVEIFTWVYPKYATCGIFKLKFS